MILYFAGLFLFQDKESQPIQSVWIFLGSHFLSLVIPVTHFFSGKTVGFPVVRDKGTITTHSIEGVVKPWVNAVGSWCSLSLS